jgi:5-methylcytosine-specific restriction endonuclease McrA
LLFDKLTICVPDCDYNRVRIFGSFKREKIGVCIRKKLFIEANNKCNLCCGYQNLVIHHIIPDGSSKLINLVVLCRDCHNIIHEYLNTKGWKFRK